MGTDAWFSAGNSQILDNLLKNPARTAPVYHFLFGDDTDPGDAAGMGACHGCELTYVLGFYLISQTFITSMAPPSAGIIPALSAAQMTLGKTMNTYWASLFHSGTTDQYAISVPAWMAMTSTDHNTMVFQGGLSATGAVMNPCVAFTKCLVEPTKHYRAHVKDFWATGPSGEAMTPATCMNPIGSYSMGPFGTTAATCPTYMCSDWCNAWTSTMAACSSCPVKSVISAMAYCSPWCNAYTCTMTTMCTGCNVCDAVNAGTYCATWCNSFTTWSGYCKGC